MKKQYSDFLKCIKKNYHQNLPFIGGVADFLQILPKKVSSVIANLIGIESLYQQKPRCPAPYAVVLKLDMVASLITD